VAGDPSRFKITISNGESRMYRIFVILVFSILFSVNANAGAIIESHYTTVWIGQIDSIYEENYSGLDYTAARLGNSHGFLTAYPAAMFATVGMNDFVSADNMILSEYGNYNNFLPAVAGGGFPPFLPPYIPPDNPPVVSEPNLTVHLLIISLVVLIFIKIRRLMCKNM